MKRVKVVALNLSHTSEKSPNLYRGICFQNF